MWSGLISQSHYAVREAGWQEGERGGLYLGKRTEMIRWVLNRQGGADALLNG